MDQRKRDFLLDLTIDVIGSIDLNEDGRTQDLFLLEEVMVDHDKISEAREIYRVKFWEDEGHRDKWNATLKLIRSEIIDVLKEVRDKTHKKPKKRNYFFIFVLGIILGLISLVAINYHLPAKKVPENVKITPQIVDEFGNRTPIVEIPKNSFKELKTDDLK